MDKGWRICVMFLLTMLPLLLAAPLDRRVDTNAEDDLKNLHKENIPQQDQRDAKLSFDLSDNDINFSGGIEFSGSVNIQGGSFGHKLQIDVHEHSHVHHKDLGDNPGVDMGDDDEDEDSEDVWDEKKNDESYGRGNEGDDDEDEDSEDVWDEKKNDESYGRGNEVNENETLLEDMILDKEQIAWLKAGLLYGELEDVIVNENTTNTETDNAVKDPNRKWPYNIIHYSIDGLTQEQEEKLRSTLSGLQTKLSSCLTFQEKDQGNRVIVGTSLVGCKSYVGYQGKPQILNLGALCWSTATIEHEFLHAIGIYHTTSRYDRDEYVRINWNNIIPPRRGKYDVKKNFNKYDQNRIYDHGLPYDYESVMHYPKIAFQKHPGLKTIDTLDPTKQDIIGNSDGVSRGDVELVRRAYGCTSGVKYLTSPNYPSHYPNKEDITQTISVEYGDIRVTFLDFQLESHSRCSYDYVKICHGDGNCNRKMCGTNLPPSFIIPTSTATVQFHSDGSVTEKGFKLSYQTTYQGRKTALIFLHGLDIGLSSVLDCNKIKAKIPLHKSVKVVCTEAPEDRNFCLMNKNLLFKFLSEITGTNPKSWYDMCEMPGGEGEDKADLYDAFQRVETQIYNLIIDGIPSENIVLAGFSQGGSLALYTALHSKHKLGGLIGVATWLPLLTKEPPTSEKTVNDDTPVYHVNAKDDPTVTEKVGYDTKEELSKVIKDYTFELVNVHGDKHLDIHKNTCFWPKMINWLWEKELLELTDRPSLSMCP